MMWSWVRTAFATCLAVFVFSDRFGVSAQILFNQTRAAHKAEYRTYDFIVIGAGTAGLALAARLSECENQSVLVLEGGQDPNLVASYKVPAASQNVLGSVIDSAFSTTPQPILSNRQLVYHRGRAVGGTSTINGLLYGRGSSSIYDNWQALGNPGWSWDDVFPYFVKSTTFNPPVGLNYSYATYDPTGYSTGPLQLGYPPFDTVSDDSFVEAVGSALGILPVQDKNFGNNIGIKKTPYTIDNFHQRNSAYDSYFAQARDRPNLTVLTLASVNLIIFSNECNSTYKADHVVVSDESLGRHFNVSVRKEIILSGGAHQGPQLLMLSGVGPSKVLSMTGITQLIDNENVGTNHQDGIYITINVRVQANASTQRYYSEIDLSQAVGTQFTQTKLGPDTNSPGLTHGMQKLSIDTLQELGQTTLLQTNRTNQAHLEYLFYPTFYPNMPTPEYAPLPNESYFSLSVGLVAAVSVGNITLQSNSHGDGPKINLNYLSNEEDQRMLVYGFKNLRKILDTPQMQQYTIGPNGGEVSPGPNVQSDDEILDYIRTASSSAYHGCGTLAMRPQDQGGVVDERLRLYGVPNLRVVDTSIFPIIPDDHSQGPTYMVAEKAADMIKEDWGIQNQCLL